MTEKSEAMVIVVLVISSVGWSCDATRGLTTEQSERSFQMQDGSKVSVILMLLLALAVAVLIIYRIAATLH